MVIHLISRGHRRTSIMQLCFSGTQIRLGTIVQQFCKVRRRDGQTPFPAFPVEETAARG